MFELMLNISNAKIPANSKLFMRNLRGNTRTIIVIKLARDAQWDQLWTDATMQHRIPFTALVLGILHDNQKMDPVVAS